MADAVAAPKKKPTKQEVAERQIRRGEIAKARLALEKAKKEEEAGRNKLLLEMDKLANEYYDEADVAIDELELDAPQRVTCEEYGLLVLKTMFAEKELLQLAPAK